MVLDVVDEWKDDYLFSAGSGVVCEACEVSVLQMSLLRAILQQMSVQGAAA